MTEDEFYALLDYLAESREAVLWAAGPAAMGLALYALTEARMMAAAVGLE